MKQKNQLRLVMQHITVIWYKECRGGPYTAQRNQMVKAARLPENYFAYCCGTPSHRLLLWQQKDGFHTEIDRRDRNTFEKRNSIRLNPIEVIPQKPDGSCELWYRYELHHGALPNRQRFDAGSGRYLPLNQLEMVLNPGEYGRVMSNGRFVDWDTGNWWYQLDIVNVLLLLGQTAPLDCFLTREPDRYSEHMDRLW